jgi:hypothetical protein
MDCLRLDATKRKLEQFPSVLSNGISSGRLVCSSPMETLGDIGVALGKENSTRRNDEESLLMLGGGKLEISLQEKFARFKRERQRERKIAQALASVPSVVRSEGFRTELREKFICRIRSYMGIPYHAMYHERDSEYYNAPLYLDCCGLVRRAIQDLSHEFGFRIGRWNQNYQFDTLSSSAVSFEELVPGDLIFVEGTYFNPKSRRQKYDIVHVEVFVKGETGKQTIGARSQKGVVSVHNSYEYISQKYEITNYFFRSIEPWLRGELTPQHLEHWAFRDANVAGDVTVSSKLSVFEDQGDQGAGGEAEDDR